jgi:hypothetical protein
MTQHQFWQSAKRHQFRGQMMTAKEIAELTGINERTMQRRIQYRLPIEGPARFGPEPRRFEFRGRLASLKEIMAETGLSRSQASKRCDGQRFFERTEAADPYPDPHPCWRIITFNHIADNICGWSRRTGLPQFVIRGRLDHGWSIERTLTTPAKSKRKTIVKRMLTGWRRASNRYAIGCMSASFNVKEAA